jgi:LysM repeat protein
MRKLFLSLTLVFLFLTLHATGDSLRYLLPKDTVFLKVDDFGNKIFGHTMAKGQTFFSLARFYGLKLETLYSYNPEAGSDGNFSPGQKVNIPIPDSAIVKSWKSAVPRQNFAPVFYVVKHGDTFYRIATHLFQIPVDTLKNRNGLEKTLLSSGQLIHVGWLSVKGIPDSLQLANTNPMGAKMQQLQMEYEAAKSRKSPKFQNGAAYWQREKKAGNDYYALHRSAPVGSVIQVTNPMKKRTVYAKVIAPIPDRAYGDDIVVVLSPAIARLLGARDPKFFVEVRYWGR